MAMTDEEIRQNFSIPEGTEYEVFHKIGASNRELADINLGDIWENSIGIASSIDSNKLIVVAIKEPGETLVTTSETSADFLTAGTGD